MWELKDIQASGISHKYNINGREIIFIPASLYVEAGGDYFIFMPIFGMNNGMVPYILEN